MKRCIACGAKLYNDPILSLDDMPANAQNIPDKDELSTEKSVAIKLCECKGCGLVQLDSDPVPYYRDVIRAGGISSTMDALRRTQYDKWMSMCHMEGKKVLEVGCGGGEFLKILSEYPLTAYGMEHNMELVMKAREMGLTVIAGYPESEDEEFEYGPYDGFTSFNFLEHQPNPYMYLMSIANNLTEGGTGLITVPAWEYIRDKKSFYEIIPDHIAYYSDYALTSLLNRCGFEVLSKEMVNRDTWEFIVKKRSRVDASGLIANYSEIKEEVYKLVSEYADAGKTIAVWGASHQGFTICATCNICDKVKYIIDSAKFKQGRYAPASHIPIISPEDAQKNPTEAIIIIAPGYVDEIAAQIRKTYDKDIKVYTLRSSHIEQVS